MKLIGKRGKIYRQLLSEGKTEAYAKRVSKGLAEGRTRKEARGYHPAERYHKRAKVQIQLPKSRLEKKKEEWAAYTYQDMLAYDDELISPFSMSSYDHTKTQIQNYIWEPLFLMHQWFEREVAHYLKFYYESASEGDGYADLQEDKRYKYRQFEWKLFDEEGELRYWLVYEKGQIIDNHTWDSFDEVQFKLNIRELKVWE